MAGKILVKSGVTFVYAPAGFKILEAIKGAAQGLNIDVTITSGSDGLHSGPQDPHHSGEAYDVRSKDLAPEVKQALLRAIQRRLGDDLPVRRFYSFLESPGTANEHIHVQRRNGTVFSILDYLDA